MTVFGVVGDLSLDIVVAQSGPRREGSDAPAKIRIGPGGQAANVAVRLARQGADAALIAPMADDPAGRLLREALLAEHVALRALPSTRTAAVIALLDAVGERTMLSDRQTLNPSTVEPLLEGLDWIHCSGYPLLDDRTGDELAGLLGDRGAKARLSVAGGSVPPEPARVARFRGRLERARPDLLVMSGDEADALLGGRPARALAAAAALQPLAAVVIVTVGAEGSAGVSRGMRLEAPAPSLPGPMLDATGSGDAFAAALLVTLAGAKPRRWPPAVDLLSAALEAGNRLGAEVSRVLGAQGRVEGEAVPA
ncbi:MAG TPA: PfkB family carbohydrate kinase [Candidatus Limnocylindria bacterium]|nr:PfkB family carbohydrate kinase [Candidatus Limnocylindria bacterium]